MRRLLATTLLWLFISGCGVSKPLPTALTAPTPEPAAPSAPTSLMAQVSAGGTVVFFRHSPRDQNILSVGNLAIADNAGACLPGSQLNDAGLIEAEAVGAAFRRHNIRVARVFASPTCRTTEMASLAFGEFETTRALTWPGMWSEQERTSLTPRLIALLSTQPDEGTNIVLISHNDVLRRDRIGVDVVLDQTEAAIFRPLGGGRFELVGRIPRDEWLQPSDAFGSQSRACRGPRDRRDCGGHRAGADQGDATTIVETATGAADRLEDALADVKEPQPR